jgi:precorrin-6B methylase 2
MKKIFRKCLYFLGLEGISRILLQQSDLKDNGWFTSVKTKQAVDKNGNPIPWLTYPLIDFIGDRLDKSIDLFEYGAGNSSIYYAGRVNSVTSIEHSAEWYKIIKANDKFNYANLDIRLVEAPQELVKDGYHEMAFTDDVNDYVRSVRDSGQKYDIIVVDGLFRNSCIIECLPSLSERGVVLLDNTHYKYQEQLKKGTDHMESKGFKRLDFWGMGPIYSAKSCTTIFYKSGNCLGI